MGTYSERYADLLEYIRKNWIKSFHEPEGALKYRFIDPASCYRGQLWDWDSFFCALAVKDIYPETAQYAQGCVLNFLEYIRPDGSVPYMINTQNRNQHLFPSLTDAERSADSEFNTIKPLLAQMALLAKEGIEDDRWLRDSYPKLQRYLAHWEATQRCSLGLFVWRSYRGSGTDNHPAIYGRPWNSSAGVELNCFMYKEYLAMAQIARLCGWEAEGTEYEEKAKALAQAIETYMWDPIDGLYYHLDVQSVKPPMARQPVTWVVPLKFRSWTCFTPMWAGIASPERAQILVQRHLMNEEEYLSDFGLRSLAKCEPVYNTVEMGNPSNWQGPIWTVSTYLMFKGALDYGYRDEAEHIARRFLDLLQQDLLRNGLLHEYYHPETGLSTINPGFMNWNGLAGAMIRDLER